MREHMQAKTGLSGHWRTARGTFRNAACKSTNCIPGGSGNRQSMSTRTRQRFRSSITADGRTGALNAMPAHCMAIVACVRLVDTISAHGIPPEEASASPSEHIGGRTATPTTSPSSITHPTYSATPGSCMCASRSRTIISR
ncbi:hypothetical protein GGI23_002853 [Coemansia sp. RSA 2559]|nr:hypothetical protein GGI23_002853 [Coemansia sp. RSA 2559]